MMKNINYALILTSILSANAFALPFKLVDITNASGYDANVKLIDAKSNQECTPALAVRNTENITINKDQHICTGDTFKVKVYGYIEANSDESHAFSSGASCTITTKGKLDEKFKIKCNAFN